MAKKLPAKRKGKGGRLDRMILLGIIVSLVVIALVLWGPFRKFRPSGGQQHAAQKAKQQEPSSVGGKQSLSAPKQESETRGKGPALLGGSVPKRTVQVAIVIDDLGMDVRPAKEILALSGRVTLAVMPGLPQSRTIANLARQSGREVLLHLPMEYHGKNGKPAPGMLRSDMTPMEFLKTVSDDVESVPGADGINNHEGSTLTENREAMKFLMAELKARNLMFLDSVTSPRSIAYATAKEFGLRAGKRDVFLDNESNNSDSIRKQLAELAEIAHKNGKAIGIGHPHPFTISELKKWLSGASREGIEIVPVSRLMN